MNPQQPKFISDVMLGSLSKWLRILGFDTLYFKDIDDNELIKISKQEQRILLTRDTRLIRRKMIDKYILVSSDDVLEQVKEVLKTLSMSSTLECFSRCAKCNGELFIVNKESVANNVPEYVFLNFDSFFKCRGCGKVYWEGSHIKSMNNKVKKILEELSIHWETSEQG